MFGHAKSVDFCFAGIHVLIQRFLNTVYKDEEYIGNNDAFDVGTVAIFCEVFTRVNCN